MRAGLAKPHLLISHLLDVAVAIVVAESERSVFEQGVYWVRVYCVQAAYFTLLRTKNINVTGTYGEIQPPT